jgi:hypothetical protein
VTGKDPGILGEDIELLPDTREKLFHVSTGKIRSSDPLEKKGVPRKEYKVALRIDADTSRSMAGSMKDREIRIENSIVLLEEEVVIRQVFEKTVKKGMILGAQGIDVPEVAFPSLLAQVTAVCGMDVDGNFQPLRFVVRLQLTNTGDVVKMSVGADDCQRAKVFHFDVVDNLIHISRGIDDYAAFLPVGKEIRVGIEKSRYDSINHGVNRVKYK